MIEYERFDEDVIEQKHGRVYYHRKLYEGEHHEIFERARIMLAQGDIIHNLSRQTAENEIKKTPYIIANLCKLIPEVPAELVGRAVGKISASVLNDPQQNRALRTETKDEIEGPTDSTFNGTVDNAQEELIEQIVANSQLEFAHWTNVVMQQVDGGLVGVIRDDEFGIRIEFIGRDFYFPHDDGRGVDIPQAIEYEDEEYLHVYRERIEEEGLSTRHILLRREGSFVHKEEELPDEQVALILNMKLEDVNAFYPNRRRPFIRYWANERTFMNPLGRSVLQNQDGKQDEINWTLTRNALVFERNGKPRLAVSKEILRTLEDRIHKKYGKHVPPGALKQIKDNELEMVSFDNNGKAIEIIQVDITKIGNIAHVKDMIKLMLMETRTSEKAIDFYMDSAGPTAQSGVAKFYDLFLSLIKSERILDEYVAFLKGLIEDCLWVMSLNDPNVKVIPPEIEIRDMIPVERTELIGRTLAPFAGPKSAQSLETTVRRLNPAASEDWIQDEIARIKEDSSADDSLSLGPAGRSSLADYLANPDVRKELGAEEEGPDGQGEA